ncbi:MAG: type II toxin-antitoxin system VapC family toxin [Actinomycetota bacterium]
MAHYVDTSALAKLVVAEPETERLRAWLRDNDDDLVSSDLTRTELIRAVRRVDPSLAVRAREVLDTVYLTEVTSAIFTEAGRLDPTALRSLDAIHVAAALDLGDDIDTFVTYDERLAMAARVNALATIAPS